MVDKVRQYTKHWRDVLLVLTAGLVLGSLVLVGYGINQNNKLALQNRELAAESKQHIDCIIKDLATPPPVGTSPNARKYIDKLGTDCNIKFTNQ